MTDVRTIRVFIASPGDLAVERRAFKEVIDDLNGDFAAGAKVKFVAVGWEDTISPVGRRPQSEINKEVEKCEVFILAMFKRWGQTAPDITKPATSYTEEEFLLARQRWDKTQREPIIHVLFKQIDAAFLVDPGTQLKKVLKFKRKLERSGQALTLSFADEAGFRQEIDRLLRAAAHQLTEGDGAPPPSPTRSPVPLPEEQLQAVRAELAATQQRLEKLEAELQKHQQRPVGKQGPAAKAQRAKQTTRTQTKLTFARREQTALRLAERAAKGALEGRVEEARQDFAKATEGTTNLRVLFLASQFYNRTGDLATAEELLERRLAISGLDAETADTAAALGNLGLIYRTRGELDRAEEMHRKALAIHEKLGRQQGVAIQYGNLGIVYGTRGELDRAEEMYRKSLAIEEKLGRHEGMASDYGNLGNLFRMRGELDRAEEMYRKSLAIDEKLGRQEGMANTYGNLGLVAEDRGEFDRARELWTKARDLYAKIGIPHMVKEQQEWLDGLPPEGETE